MFQHLHELHLVYGASRTSNRLVVTVLEIQLKSVCIMHSSALAL